MIFLIIFLIVVTVVYIVLGYRMYERVLSNCKKEDISYVKNFRWYIINNWAPYTMTIGKVKVFIRERYKLSGNITPSTKEFNKDVIDLFVELYEDSKKKAAYIYAETILKNSL